MYARRAVPVAAILLATSLMAPMAGTIHAQVEASPAARTTIFAGLQGGGIFSSSDGGATWQESDNGLPPDANVTALATLSPTTIYAGTDGEGLYRSSDGGQSWQQDDGDNGDLAAETVVGVTVDASGGALYVAGQSGTVYVSYSSGADWAESPVDTAGSLTAIAVNPANPGMVLVGTSDDGIYLSTDGGTSWQQTSAMPANDSINALAVDPRSGDVAYAATDQGLYQTIDGGNTWQLEQRGLPYNVVMDAVAVDPAHGATVVAGASDGTIYRSADGGTSWLYAGDVSDGAMVTSLIFDPAHSDVVYCGTLGGIGVNVSYNGGANWQPAYALTPYSGVLSLAALAGAVLPTAPVPPIPRSPYAQYFPQSHHIVRYPFLSFFNKYGGVKIFGLPLTEVFEENGQPVQYFERARLVIGRNGVQISPLGLQVTAGHYFPPVASSPSTASRLYFASTGHSLSGRFLSFWRTHHGALLFGAPISQPLYEQNGDGTGRRYLVQYFQNARLEYHPELAGSNYAISIGLLGQQVLKSRGWL